MRSAGWLGDWRAWAFLVATTVIAALDIVVGREVVLLPFLVIPVVGSAVLGRPALTLLTTVVAAALTLVTADLYDYDVLDLVVRLTAYLAAGALSVVLAVALSRERSRLTQERERFRRFATLSADVFVLGEESGRVVWVSDSVHDLLGWRPEEMVGRAMAELLHPDDLATLRAVQDRMRQGEDVRYQARLATADGHWHWVELNVGPSVPTGGVGERIGTWRDIQPERDAAEAVQASERAFRLIAENSTDVIMHVRDERVVWVSPSLTRMLGWRPSDWIGRSLLDYVDPEDLPTALADRDRRERGERTVSRVRVRGSDGSHHWAEFHAQPYLDDTGAVDGAAMSFRTIDRAVQAEQELERRARFDDLTGTLKRSEALERLNDIGQHLRHPGDETAGLFIDVDDFKSVNDTWGHAAGDALLRALSDRIRGIVRVGDTVARMGGDEFLVILEGLHSIDEAASVAEKIRQAAQEPVRAREGDVTATVSIGVTMSSPIETADDLVTRADEAMYAAKRGGRNQVVTVPPGPAGA